MLTKLDLWLFGNGHGLAQPYFDGRFFWLVDTMNGREHGRGRLYSFSGGHGAQLQSIEWRMPHPAERRRLAGETFTVFQARRTGPRVEIAWAMRLPDGLDAANAKIQALEHRLCHRLTLGDDKDLDIEMRETARLREQGRAWKRERSEASAHPTRPAPIHSSQSEGATVHDAIRRPLGVTPDSGAEFYSYRLAEEAEERRAASTSRSVLRGLFEEEAAARAEALLDARMREKAAERARLGLPPIRERF